MQFLIVLVVPLFACGILGQYTANTLNNYINNCSIPTLKNGNVQLNGRNIRFSCSPGLKLFGTAKSSCVYGQWKNHIPICATAGCDEIMSPPNGTVVSFKNRVSLTCNSGYELVGNDRAFCDGKNWDRQIGSCRKTNSEASLFCDFEGQLLCGWKNYLMNEKDWTKRNMGRHGTGPQHDHTKIKKFEGFFMVLEGYGPSYPKQSYFNSPMYSLGVSNNSCFKFFYHMYGVTPGIIRIFVKRRSQTTTNFMATVWTSALLEIKNQSSNAWIEALVRLPQQYDWFQIIIQGEMMRGQRTDLAIDDVEILFGAACEGERVIVTERPTDEPGGVLEVQSCEYRCRGTVTTPSSVLTSTLKCNCYDGCADEDTCCPDFEQFCIFEDTTIDLNMYTTTSSNTTVQDYVLLPENNTQRNTIDDRRITDVTSGAKWLIIACVKIAVMITGTCAFVYVYRERTRVSTVADMMKYYHCKSATEEFCEIGVLTEGDDLSSLKSENNCKIIF